MSQQKNRSQPNNDTKKRVNLRVQRHQQGLTRKDIHIRVGIPLAHIEALETGVVPKSMRGKKLLHSKQAYLKFLGFSKHCKLDVKTPTRKRKKSSKASSRTGSTEIVAPTTSRSIFTGFAIAATMVVGLKTLSIAFDNPSFSFDGMLDSMVAQLNEADTEGTREKTSETISPKNNTLTAPANLASSIASTANSQGNLDALVSDLLTDLEEPEPVGPTGPNSLELRVVERSRIVFTCDGHIVKRGLVKRNDRLECQFGERAIVELSDLLAVEVRHNDKKVKPMGPQGAGRRLTFVHDGF